MPSRLPEKGDDVGDSGFGGEGDVLAEGGFDGVVVLFTVESFLISPPPAYPMVQMRP